MGLVSRIPSGSWPQGTVEHPFAEGTGLIEGKRVKSSVEGESKADVLTRPARSSSVEGALELIKGSFSLIEARHSKGDPSDPKVLIKPDAQGKVVQNESQTAPKKSNVRSITSARYSNTQMAATERYFQQKHIEAMRKQSEKCCACSVQ